MTKTVSILAHKFDCLPGHVQISARGSGSNLSVALCDAVRTMFKDRRLRHKRINDFRLAIVVITDK